MSSPKYQAQPADLTPSLITMPLSWSTGGLSSTTIRPAWIRRPTRSACSCAQRSTCVGQLRRGPVVQGDREPLVLDQDLRGQLGAGALGQVGHRGHPGQRGRLGDHLAVVPHLEPVEPVEVDVAQRLEARAQEADRAGGDDGHPGDRAGQLLEDAQHRRNGLGGVRVLGDGREHAVEVEEELGVPGVVSGEAPSLGGTQWMRWPRGLCHGFQTTRSADDVPVREGPELPPNGSPGSLYYRGWQLPASVWVMARGHPWPAGRPDLRQERHGARIPTPCQEMGAGGGGPRADRVARPLEQACDISPYRRRGQHRNPAANVSSTHASTGRSVVPGPACRCGARPSRPGLRAGHLGPAVRPGGVPPVHRPRGGRTARGDLRIGGQTPPPRARLVRPSGAAHAGRAAHQVRPAGPAGALQRRGRHGAGRAQPRRPERAPARLPQRLQRHPDPVGGARAGRRGPRSHAGQQGHAAAGEGGRGRPDGGRVPARPGQRPHLGRDGRPDAHRGAGQRPVRGRGARAGRRPRTCPATPAW